MVAREIARRQQQVEEARRLIVSGDSQRADGNYQGAVLSYKAAFTGMSDSAMTEEMRDLALSRFASTSVTWAEQLIEGAEFDVAAEAVNAVLDQDFAPDYKPARKLKRQLEDPDYYNRALTPGHLKNAKEVERLLRLGNDFIEIASFDEAIQTYRKVLAMDPTNTAARRGMEEVERAMMNYHLAARDQTRATMLRKVDESWETGVPLADFAIGGVGVRTGIAAESSSQTLRALLDDTILAEVDFQDASLAEVVEFLTVKSRELDPLGKGANIVLDLAAGDDAARNALVNLRLTNIPLSELMKYVTRDTGTKFIVEQFAVRIVSEAVASQALLTRRYTVPPDFLSTSRLDEASEPDDPFADPAGGGGSGLKLRRIKAREFFEKMGIPFPDGATAFYNPIGSQLTIRNTETNLNTIEALIETTRQSGPRQVEIKTIMIEVKETKLRELGFDWLLGQFNVPGSDRVFGAGGTRGATQSPYSGDTVRADFPFVAPGTDFPLGRNPITAGNRSGDDAQARDTVDSLINESNEIQALTRKSPGVFAVGGALTDPQVQVVIRSLSQGGTVDVMATPATVTRPGQRSTIEVSREFIYPTEYDPPEIPQDFIGFGGVTTGGVFGTTVDPGSFPVTPSHPTAFEMRPVGTRLEVEPIIGSDNYTIDLTIAPEIVRFEGFINYGSPIFAGQQVLTQNEILMPVFNTIKESTSVTIYDGATVVIGGLVNDVVTETEDETPIASGVPVLGRFFRSKSLQRERKAIILMVRARIIDAAGEPVNVTAR